MSEKAIARALDDIARASVENIKRNPCDFVGEDGLLVCGVCGKRKEKMINTFIGNSFISRKVGCICDCEIERKQREKEEKEKQEALERNKKARTASLIDEKFFNARFETFQETSHNQRNLKLCKRYASSFDEMVEKNQGLLFWGDVGTGKSYASACIANYLIDKNVSVIMTSFVKLLQIVTDDEEYLISRLTKAKLVIFDDLGSERGTDYALEKIYNIVDSRYRSNLPMIVTTNLTLKEMFDETDYRYKRIFDRVLEVCYPMQWTGPSWRKVQAKDRLAEMEKVLGGFK